MSYLGEILSLLVAVFYTTTALACEVATKRAGIKVFSFWRMALALVFLALIVFCMTGQLFPSHVGTEGWLWLLASGIIGLFLGDWCLFKAYLTIGSRYGLLLFTLNPVFAVFSGWLLLHQRLDGSSLLAMSVTLSGIFISILGKGDGHKLGFQLPVKGIFYGLGAAAGQGIGYVVSVVGMDHYHAHVPTAALPELEASIPLNANLIRCFAAFACFGLWLLFSKEKEAVRRSLEDVKFLLVAVIAVLTGPIVGVTLSLVAANYCDAGIASTLMSTTPILILVPTYYLYRQKITPKMFLGALITVVGVSLFFLL